jgi:hypothetical protein
MQKPTQPGPIVTDAEYDDIVEGLDGRPGDPARAGYYPTCPWMGSIRMKPGRQKVSQMRYPHRADETLVITDHWMASRVRWCDREHVQPMAAAVGDLSAALRHRHR